MMVRIHFWDYLVPLLLILCLLQPIITAFHANNEDESNLQEFKTLADVAFTSCPNMQCSGTYVTYGVTVANAQACANQCTAGSAANVYAAFSTFGNCNCYTSCNTFQTTTFYTVLAMNGVSIFCICFCFQFL